MAAPDKKAKGAAGAGGDKATVRKKNSSPRLNKTLSKGQLKGDGGGDADDLDAWIKSRQLLKPDDQLELTEAELGEEITKMLTPTNTSVIRNLVVYSFKEGAFVVLPPAGNTVTLLQLEGTALHIESEEARDQIEELGEVGYPLPPPRSSLHEEIEKAERAEQAEEAEGEEDEDKAAKGQDDEGEEEEEAEDAVEAEAVDAEAPKTEAEEEPSDV